MRKLLQRIQFIADHVYVFLLQQSQIVYDGRPRLLSSAVSAEQNSPRTSSNAPVTILLVFRGGIPEDAPQFTQGLFALFSNWFCAPRSVHRNSSLLIALMRIPQLLSIADSVSSKSRSLGGGQSPSVMDITPNIDERLHDAEASADVLDGGNAFNTRRLRLPVHI